MSKSIELLSPAKDYDTAIAAINHGADAVYIGASSFGARAAAGNSLEDLKRLVDYAHQFRARIYTTVNTIVYDHELRKVEHLVKELYKIGIDALIVQDMGLLRLDLPPIELHASTQCDTRTPEKARFLQDVGFSQIVLARELTLSEITEICNAVTIPVETFVHGALCVSYSGSCHAGEAMLNRSANRGECPQVCRMKYDLIDNRGNAIVRDRYLLSLRDFNASSSLSQLLKAGVSSFKIEGRLKDISYVKNITAYYRTLIDKNISTNPKLYQRASCGKESLTFSPNPQKSFNRGFTDYFLTSRRPDQELASIYTPKSLGEELKAGEMPDNGDGISFFDKENDKYTGFRVNRVEGKRIIPARPFKIPKSIVLHRTFDNKWEQLMSRGDTSTRKISVDIELNRTNATAVDERGCKVVLPVEFEPLTAKAKPISKEYSQKQVTQFTHYEISNRHYQKAAIFPHLY